MDFFQHQDQARRRTGLLVVYYVLAVIFIIVAIYSAIAGLVMFAESKTDFGGARHSFWIPELFAAVVIGGLVIVFSGTVYKIIELSGGGEHVATSLGGRQVQANTRELSERILLNVVEEMALASGTPVPPVYLLEESSINAFAAGTTPQNAVIGVTRGAIESLKRDELQGVIAHEFSHVLNGDMRLNIRLMGVLNGILLIAMLGYLLMRLTGGSTSSSSNSDKKSNGAWLLIVGLILYVIGYIGVFFSHLIKSAVSRQREFLADASAVQFTRNPPGIAGALKRIGGLTESSRIKSPRAEEASHMFFGNALTNSFLQALATHPPLPQRVRRIEPNFNGEFPPTLRVTHSQADIRDPHSLAMQLTGQFAPATTTIAEVAEVHQAAIAGANEFAAEPASAVKHVGDPGTEHLDYARAMLVAIPESVTDEVRSPLGAVATVYGLLLDDDEAEVRRRQLDYLSENANPKACAELKRMLPLLRPLAPEMKLPLISLAVPALHELSPQQIIDFRRDITWMIKADKQISLFEFGVHRLVLKRLLPRLERQPAKLDKHRTLAAIAEPCSVVLSTLIHLGNHQGDAQEAFSLGSAQFADPQQVKLLPAAQSRLLEFDQALDSLVLATHPLKKQILSACAACICADGKVSVEEAELLRVVADALECPMPPILPDAA